MARKDEEGMSPAELRQHRIVMRNLREREKMNSKPKETTEWMHKPLVTFPLDALDKVKVDP